MGTIFTRSWFGRGCMERYRGRAEKASIGVSNREIGGTVTRRFSSLFCRLLAARD